MPGPVTPAQQPRLVTASPGAVLPDLTRRNIYNIYTEYLHNIYTEYLRNIYTTHSIYPAGNLNIRKAGELVRDSGRHSIGLYLIGQRGPATVSNQVSEHNTTAASCSYPSVTDSGDTLAVTFKSK